jgi:hypothetical protein
MNDQELKRLWQQQPLPAEEVKRGEDIILTVKKKMREFNRTIFWRDVREVAACIIIVIVFLPGFFKPGAGLSKAGCLVEVLAAVFIGCRLVLSKRKFDRLTAGDSLREHLLLERRKLDNQIHLLRTVLWWYILPVYIGAVMFTFGLDRPLAGKLTFTSVYALVCAGIWWLNQYAVRKQLLPLKAELEKTLEGVETYTENNDETKPQ